MIKTIIVDDHQIFLDGLKEVFKAFNDITIVGEANNGVDLIDLLSKTTCDVVLMDVNMPKMDGVEATKYVKQNYPDIKILMLTMHDSKAYIEKLLKAGADGYVLKNTAKGELQLAIETVCSDQNYYSPMVTQTIMNSVRQKEATNANYGEVELTDREKDVLKLIAKELTTHEIAEKLFISHHTVESHRKNLIAKLGVRSLAGLVKYAVKMGLDED